MSLSLRPYQAESFDALISYFESHPVGDPLLVLPCGAGKSVLIGKIAEYAMQFDNQKIIVASHIKELLQQDAEKFHKLQQDISFGMYCAGLGKKQLGNRVTFASVQSAYKHAIKFGFVNLFILDEAHLLSDNDTGMYRQFLNGLWEINPRMRLIGLTATGWRTRTGLLTEGDGALFTDVAHEIQLKRLVDEGWISRTIGKQARTQGDTSGIDIRAGEFVLRQAETIFDEQQLVSAAIKEMIACGENRRTWLIFCTSVKHAEHVAQEMNAAGISCKAVSEKTSSVERAGIIRDLKNGSLRAATNVSVLTTGTDIPSVDMTVFLRPTDSPGLFLQMAGRGFRLSPETQKENHLLLDLAGNLLRHGPITHISSPEIIASRKQARENLGKICPNCESVCSSSAKECLDCGHEFPEQPRKIAHSERAHYLDPMSDEPVLSPEAQWYTVKEIRYEKHFKTTMDGPPSMCVIYKVGYYTFKEWVSIENPKGRPFGVRWWLEHTDAPFPDTVDRAIEMCRNGHLDKVAAKILVKKVDKYPRIISRSLMDRFEWQSAQEKKQEPVIVDSKPEISWGADDSLF